MVKVIVAREKIDCSHLVGQFVDETHYDVLIEEDTDCYQRADCDPVSKSNCTTGDCADCSILNTKDERKIAFKFRKNFFSKKEQEQAYAGLRDAAVASQNRGLAAGPKGDKCGGREWVTEVQYRTLDYLTKIDPNNLGFDLNQDLDRIRFIHENEVSSRGLVWLAQEVKEAEFKWDNWLANICKMTDLVEIVREAKYVQETFISDTTYANVVYSGIAGWFDRYPRIPYGRATSYTQNHYDKFQMAFPFLQSLDRGFRELLPWRWGNQRAAADKIDPAFLVPETVFTTITVNKTFRTAAHYDAGDFADGLSNLLVLSNNGNYSGGYLVFPEYRIAVNVRPGDLLLVNNHEILHGNTPIVMNDDVAERISLVCYLREGMLNLGSKEYEDHRYNYVESRRKNKEHPLQRKLWNGISENCFSDKPNPNQNWENAKEWYEYLNKVPGRRPFLEKHHPWLIEYFEKSSGLEDFFS
jgi:hypothetical protein